MGIERGAYVRYQDGSWAGRVSYVSLGQAVVIPLDPMPEVQDPKSWTGWAPITVPLDELELVREAA